MAVGGRRLGRRAPCGAIALAAAATLGGPPSGWGASPTRPELWPGAGRRAAVAVACALGPRQDLRELLLGALDLGHRVARRGRGGLVLFAPGGAALAALLHVLGLDPTPSPFGPLRVRALAAWQVAPHHAL